MGNKSHKHVHASEAQAPEGVAAGEPSQSEKAVYGLLGRTLGHAYSPRIHKPLGGYDYHLFEVEPEDVESFVRSGSFAGINVTVPYKETVMPFCDKATDAAKIIGCVNTIVREPDGTLLGDNTDYYGFAHLLDVAGIKVANCKVLVLGSGGASKTVQAVLADQFAREVVVVSRTGRVTYEDLANHYDAQVIVNTTPVGMYPHCPASPLDLESFARCGELREGYADGLFGVVDVVYNPARTGLMLQAEKPGHSACQRPSHAGGAGSCGGGAVSECAYQYRAYWRNNRRALCSNRKTLC